jgi:xanthine dehydrogenase/oxidase
MLAEPLELLDGDLQNRELESDVIVSGEINIGGQEHFYLETNSCLAIPTENGSMEIFASTQNANETQLACAHACNISANHVVCRVKRIGGGFGGKETRSLVFTTPTAVAAHALGIPVRINIDRDVDMQVSGQRHAFHGKYRAGCTLSGKLKFLDVALYSNAGFSFDLSEPVLSRALLHVDNTYKWPALHATGQLCRTNQPSHTAFRGFGGPQGMYVTETVIEHLSSALRERNVANASSFWLRSNNFYATGDETHFGEVIEQFNVPEAWERILRTAEVERREAEIELFNTQHKWKKRALSIIPTKYGINYTAKFMNQAGALVHIYSDGTVLVSHGGMEMGQGVHTKMCQVVARALEIPFELVHISETSTNVVANAQATAGSMTTDMYGMALLNACEQLNARLTPLKNSNPKASWKEIITTAYFSRVDLTAHGFYKVPDERCGFDWRKKVISHNSERGTPFNYFTQGVACAEVEIDLLSGDLIVRRADVVMDVGQSINPAIDVGQIEGAFVQGFGWSTMEELIWGDDDHKWVRPGNLFTRGPGTYKIPSFNDVPEDFRIHLMDKSNKRAVHSSKGIGEPPFFMGTSVLFAARNALMKVRCEFGLNDYFRLNLPATSERIRMLVPDEIAVKTVGNIEQLHSYQPHGSW